MTQRIPVRAVSAEIALQLSRMNDLNDDYLSRTRRIYLPLLKALDRSGISVEKDIAYGPDARHRLDIHLPRTRPSKPMPVVVFFHGGGFTRGDKIEDGGPIYGNVADFFVRNGMIGVNATYRLAPAHQWPAGAEDVGAAVSWVRRNIAGHGGDPDSLFVCGHSAGAAHVAAYALHKDLDAGARAGLAGVILVSGGYGAHIPAYYGDDAAKLPSRGTVGNVVWGDFDVLLTAAEYEPPRFPQGLAMLVDELIRKGNGRVPRFKYLLGHNHYSATLSFGTDDPTLSGEALDFVQYHMVRAGRFS